MTSPKVSLQILLPYSSSSFSTTIGANTGTTNYLNSCNSFSSLTKLYFTTVTQSCYTQDTPVSIFIWRPLWQHSDAFKRLLMLTLNLIWLVCLTKFFLTEFLPNSLVFQLVFASISTVFLHHF